MKNKFYCYVDETGQDTLGKLFVFGLVLTDSEREKIIKKLETIEKETKKGKVKWTKAKYQYKMSYIKTVFTNNLPIKAYFSVYKKDKQYLTLIVLSIAKTIINAGFNEKKGIILIDAISNRGKKFISNQLHKLNIKTKKVRSVKKEENDAFLRLADSLAGFIRKVEEKDEKMIKIYQKLIKEKKIFKI